MALSKAALDFLKKAEARQLFPKENTPAPPKEKDNISDAIQKKREQLELARLDKELAALNSPSTSVDYVKQMLDLQQSNFKQLLEMQQKQHELDIKLAKIEAGGDDGGDFTEDFIGSLMPLLPELMKRKSSPEGTTEKKEVIDKTMIPNAEQLEFYKKEIKAGRISEETAYNDLLTAMPQMAGKITKEKFHEEFEKIKNG